jgi:branched-chain amino acid transport system substrate-binding protein
MWWGKELFGIDNALVGAWPVVAIENGRARIQDFVSMQDWWTAHKSTLVGHLRALDLMWDQRETLAAST